jgi:hypothetical protein
LSADFVRFNDWGCLGGEACDGEEGGLGFFDERGDIPAVILTLSEAERKIPKNSTCQRRSNLSAMAAADSLP